MSYGRNTCLKLKVEFKAAFFENPRYYALAGKLVFKGGATQVMFGFWDSLGTMVIQTGRRLLIVNNDSLIKIYN